MKKNWENVVYDGIATIIFLLSKYYTLAYAISWVIIAVQLCAAVLTFTNPWYIVKARMSLTQKALCNVMMAIVTVALVSYGQYIMAVLFTSTLYCIYYNLSK